MAWYDGLLGNQQGSEPARTNERSNGQVEALSNWQSGGYNDGSKHDHIVTGKDGTNVEYMRENGVVLIDVNSATADPHNAYPDRPA